MRVAGREFREVWVADYEFNGNPGDVVTPVCLVARELAGGRTIRLWADEMASLSTAPYATDEDALFVAYYASAEMGCHLALGWAMPENVLDLFAEYRVQTNGIADVGRASLLNALASHGLAAITCDEKETMRQRILLGGPWKADERIEILDYCESDVVACADLLGAMGARIDLPRALIRGRYMKAAARIEGGGIPIDASMLAKLRSRWDDIQGDLIAAVDADYGVYEGNTFREVRFAAYLEREGIAWPRLESGRLALDDDTFRDMAKAHPQLGSLRELRATLGRMRLSELSVGRDGRNRCMLSAFRARTGRNQPSNVEVHLRTGRLAAWTDPSGTRPRCCIHRLVAAGVRDRGRALRRSEDAGGLHDRRSIPRLRQAGRRRTARRDETDARGGARAVQGLRARRAVRHG